MPHHAFHLLLCPVAIACSVGYALWREATRLCPGDGGWLEVKAVLRGGPFDGARGEPFPALDDVPPTLWVVECEDTRCRRGGAHMHTDVDHALDDADRKGVRVETYAHVGFTLLYEAIYVYGELTPEGFDEMISTIDRDTAAV